MLVARAVQKGQMDGAGEDSSMCGSASVRGVTMRIRLKFCGAGGDVVAHSRVSASQGVSPAGAPAIRLRMRFQSRMRKLMKNITAPIVESRLRPAHGMSAG